MDISEVLMAGLKNIFGGELKGYTELLQESESKMGILMDVITGIRNVRGEMNISPTMALQVLIQSEDDETRKVMETHQDLVINLARLSSLEVQNTGRKPTIVVATAVSTAPLTSVAAV